MNVPAEAVVLAGGRGTRLAGVLTDRPKPLAEIGGRAFLEYLLDQLARHGVQRVVVSAGHLADRMLAHFRAGAARERPLAAGAWFEGYRASGRAGALDVRVVVETEARGTGGALSDALAHTEGDAVLAMNGDALVIADLAALAARHAARGARATLLATRVPDRSRYGSLELGPDDRVLGFHEKSTERSGPGFINAGVYVLARDALAAFSGRSPLSLERDVFPALADVFALPGEFPFIDIGTPETYAAAAAFVAAHAVEP